VTPLEALLAELIAAEGPLRIDRYMGLCLGHPRHGYYITRDPLGDKGDFVTAPEVSQVFGELVGVWAVGVWAAMGQPEAFNLVELGPGRGTLMADVLRTLRKAAPACAAAASVHLVETSPVLRQRQRAAVGEGATWHDRLEDVPDGPMILLANEFFDAIPIRQFERRDGVWRERVIGLVWAASCRARWARTATSWNSPRRVTRSPATSVIASPPTAVRRSSSTMATFTPRRATRCRRCAGTGSFRSPKRRARPTSPRTSISRSSPMPAARRAPPCRTR